MMKSKNIFFFVVIVLLSLLGNIQSSARTSNDVENPISAPRLDYTRLSQNEGPDDDEDSDTPEAVNNRAWTVPRGQFDVGIPIYGTIFGFMTTWGEDDPISLAVRAIYIVSFMVCAQVYFGFYISVHRRTGSCYCLPEFKYNKVDFGASGMDVSFGRWASAPLSWISEVISFLPPGAYEYLEKAAFFPKRQYIHIIFMVQLLYYFGLYDCYRSSVLPT